MPKSHSALYLTPGLIQNIDIPVKINLQHLPVGTTYEALVDLLREVNDAQFGIVSTLEEGNRWVRDATSSLPLNERIPHDSPIIEVNNMLLRLLSRIRPIEFAMDKKNRIDDIRMMRTNFRSSMEDILSVVYDPGSNEEKIKKILKSEQDFNQRLLEYLHDANLTSGIFTQKDAEKLLGHYRNLSSVLRPASTMVTLTYDKVQKVLQRETQYPVTKKTERQIQDLQVLEKVIPYPNKQQRNAHTKLKYAFQEADNYFAQLIKDPHTALPAQARKTHLVGAKNAFIVKSELFFDIQEDQVDLKVQDQSLASQENTLVLARMGSPTYIGKGETESQVLAHTEEVLEQIKEKAKEILNLDPLAELNLHITILNTDSPIGNQSTIVKNITNAVKYTDSCRSYLPTNWDGTNRIVEVAETLNFAGLKRPRGAAPSDKEKRMESASVVMRAAAQTPGFLSVVNCASGQDRTGTAVEKTQQDWMKKRYQLNNPANFANCTNIEKARAQGGNAAEIASHHVNGSPGMKLESKAGDTFGPEANTQFYRKSAGTNKKNNVVKVDYLKKPSFNTLNVYYDELAVLQLKLRSLEAGPIKTKCEDLMTCIIATGGKRLSPLPKPLDSKDLYSLRQLVSYTTKTLNELDNTKNTKENVQVLAKITASFTDKNYRLKKLGIALMVFGCAVLVGIGILAAIPSGGASLPAVLAGIAGLNTLGVGIASGGLVLTTVGTAITGYNQERGLVAKLSLFKSTVNKANGVALRNEAHAIENAIHPD